MEQTFIRTLIKASRTKDGRVIKDISFPAARGLMIALTKDVGGDFLKSALEQYKIILRVFLKPELDKHIFKIPYGRPSKNHIHFTESIEHKLDTTRKFNEYLKDRIKFGLGFKDIALQPIVIPLNADDQLKRIFVLLCTLKCGNNNENILTEFTALLNQLYINKKISKLLYKTLYYKGKNQLDKNLKN